MTPNQFKAFTSHKYLYFRVIAISYCQQICDWDRLFCCRDLNISRELGQYLAPCIAMSSAPTVQCTVYPKKYAHGFSFAVLCCGYTLTDCPISIRLTSLALWQSNDCPSASKATLMNIDEYFMWIHYEWLHNHNKAKHNKTVCIFLGIYCSANISLSSTRRISTIGVEKWYKIVRNKFLYLFRKIQQTGIYQQPC